MKRTIRIIALCLVLVMAMAALVSCSGPSGEYEAVDKLGNGQRLNFSGDEVTIDFLALGRVVYSIEATFEVANDKISFDFIDEDNISNDLAKAFIKTLETPVTYREADGMIKIGIVEYTAVES